MTRMNLDQYGFNRVGRILKKLRDSSYDTQDQCPEDRSVERRVIERFSKRLRAPRLGTRRPARLKGGILILTSGKGIEPSVA